MKVIAFAPMYNKPRKKDATKAFQPEAKKFKELHAGLGALPFLFNNHLKPSVMRSDVLSELALFRNLDGVAFFCHGTKKTLQPGFNLSNINELAKGIAEVCVYQKPVIALYACDTARDLDKSRWDDRTDKIGGDGGFADALRDTLCRAGAIYCRVSAHSDEGHTDKLPHVRFFEGQGSATGGIGGYYPVPFKSKNWKKWIVALKTDFRFQYPFMTATEIQDYLSKT